MTGAAGGLGAHDWRCHPVNPFSILFMGLGAFLIVAGVVYGAHSHDYEGLALSITVAGGALIIGGYLASAVRRARGKVVQAEAAEPGTVADDEPHVGPTIWPAVFAVSAIGLVVGAVTSRWALLPGGVLFVAASVGWVHDVHRQWHLHAAGHPGHGGPAPAELPAHTGPPAHPRPGAGAAPGDGPSGGS
jgi:hypothetical protein